MLLPSRISKRELEISRQRKMKMLEKKIYGQFLNSITLNAKQAIINKQIELRIIEELEEKGTSSFNPFYWQKELLGEYNFFGSVIGFIDSGLDQLQAKINFEKSFLNENGTSKKYEELQEKYIELNTRRENIVKDYQEVKSSKSLEVIDKSVCKFPGYANFGEIYASNVSNELQFPLQTEYIKAYTEGYRMNRKGLKDDSIYTVYDNNISKIKEEVTRKVKILKD